MTREEEKADSAQDRIRTMLSTHEDDVLSTIRAMTGDERWKSIAITQIQLGYMAAKRALYDGKRVGD